MEGIDQATERSSTEFNPHSYGEITLRETVSSVECHEGHNTTVRSNDYPDVNI